MADRKISALPAADALGEDDVIPLVQDGDTVKASLADVSAFISGEVDTITTPADLPFLLAWYSADTQVYSDLGVTLATNGQTVKQWNDLSGNGHHLKDATYGPVYNTTTFNGNDGLNFTQAGGTKMTTLINSVPMNTSAVSCFALATYTGSAQTQARLVEFRGAGAWRITQAAGAAGGVDLDTDVDANDSGSVVFIGRSIATGNAVCAYRNTFELATVATSTAAHRYGAIFDGANVTVYKDLSVTAQETSSGVLAPFGTLRIGANWSPEPCPGLCGLWDGIVAEIVICRAALNSSQRSQLDTYFTTKWGL